MKKIPKEGDQVWDPAEEFIRRELKYRRDRPIDGMAPILPLVQTNAPLGEAGEKQDPESHDRVRQILGLTPEGASLESSLASFNPTFAQLSELQKIMRTELRAIKDLITDVDPVELPTMTEESTIIPFDHPQLTEMERQALGAHTIGGAVQYVKQDEAELAGKKHYFVDRNIIRAYREFYSPWIAIWLYDFGCRLAPKSAMVLEDSVPADPNAKDKSISSGKTFPQLKPGGSGAVQALWWHRLYVESAIWYAVLACQKKRGARSPKDVIKTTLSDLVRLGRELKGRRLDLDPDTVRLLSADGIPYGVVRGLVELSDPSLYKKGPANQNARERLDGITNVVATAWRELGDNSTGQRLLAGVLYDSSNVQQVFAGRKEEWRAELAYVPAKEELLRRLNDELPTAFLLALKGWKPEDKSVPFSAYLAGCVKLHPWKTVIPVSEEDRDHLDFVEDYNEIDSVDERTTAGHPNSLPGLRSLERLMYVDDRNKRLELAKQRVTKTQLRVAEEYERALSEGHEEREARKIAAQKLNMKPELFRQHLRGFRKKL